MIRLPTTEFSPGQRLPYDIFMADGKLLLARGLVIASDEEAALVRDCGHRRNHSPSAFRAMSQLAERLGLINKDILERSTDGNRQQQIVSLARDFIEVADADPDAAFASIHLDRRHSYLVVHSMMTAIVCSRLALLRKFTAQQRLSLTCAALTHDIGLLQALPRINANETLGIEERTLVSKHVDISLEMLEKFGVTDPLWLETVACHHEFLDGSGYRGDSGERISMAGRIVSLADSYSAMLRPRPYRERVLAPHALETLYANQLDRYDGQLIETLIWDFGFYPPGCMLKLANQEMAVAIRNTPGILDTPVAAALTDAHGRPWSAPMIRDTNDPAFAIVNVLDPSMAARAGNQVERCWDAKDDTPN